MWYSCVSAVFLYFGPSSASVRPPNPTGLPARSKTGNINRDAEEVLRLLRTVHERETRRDDVVAAELQGVEVPRERVERVGRPAELEPARRVAVEPATAEVPAGVPTRRVLQQQPVVVLDRGADRLVQPLPLATVLRRAHGVVPQGDPGLDREALDRLGEVETLDLADERDRVAALLAAEAVVEAELGVDREARGLLSVEGAEADESASGALERNVLADQRDDVGGLPNPRDVLVENPHGLRVRRRPPTRRPRWRPVTDRCRARPGAPRDPTRDARGPGRTRTGPSSPRRR